MLLLCGHQLQSTTAWMMIWSEETGLLLRSIKVSYRQWKSACPWKPDLPFSNDRLVHAASHIDEHKEISRGQGTRRCWHNPNSAT